MPQTKIITFEGKNYKVPADATLEEIAEVVGVSSSPSQFEDVQGGSSTTPSGMGETGILAGIKRGVSGLTAPLHSPLETAKALVTEAGVTADKRVLLSRALEAFERAKTEHGGTGLDPYLHAGAASIPFVGGAINEGLERSNTDLSGALAEAGTNILGGELLYLGGKGAVKAVANKMAPSLAQKVKLYSTRGTDAVGPERVNLEKGAMDTTLREGGTDPISQRKADVRVLQNLKNSGEELNAVVKSTPPTTTIPKHYLQKIVDEIESRLDLDNQDHSSAFQFLDYIRKKIEKMDGSGNFHEVNRLRQDLDRGIALTGKGFTPSVKGDVFSLRVEKDVANSLRELTGEFSVDPKKWAEANESFSGWKTRAEIIERRRPEVLAQKGRGIDEQIKSASGPIVWPKNKGIPGLGRSVADDIHISAGGKYMAGGLGVAGAEGLNLLTQNRFSPTYNRLQARVNELLLNASGKSYGDFYPSTPPRPSPLLEEVRAAKANPASAPFYSTPTTPRLGVMGDVLSDPAQAPLGGNWNYLGKNTLPSSEPLRERPFHQPPYLHSREDVVPIPLSDPLGFNRSTRPIAEPNSGVVAPDQMKMDPNSGVTRTTPVVNQPEMMRDIKKRVSTAEMLEMVRRYMERNRERP